MKRKVIQIAGSTQLISLPRAWAKKNNILKGQELDVMEEGDKVIVRSSAYNSLEKDELDITRLNEMAPRCIRSLYKRGIDELKVTFSNPESLKLIQEAVSRDVVGFEILEQGPTYCVIKSVSGSTEEFDPMLRRTYLLLLAMADEFLTTLNKGDYAYMKSVAFMEQTNNRFTIVLRRHMNKNGKLSYDKVGPLYFIVESLENIGDQYKYSCKYFNSNFNRKLKLRKETLDLVQKSNSMLKSMYELFYKFDEDKLVNLKLLRNQIVDNGFGLLKKDLNNGEMMLVHHSLSIASRVFGMVGPYLVLNL